MSTSKEFLSFVLDQLSSLEGVTHRQMMGEYIIYYKGKIAAELCDNRFFVKPVEAAKKYLPSEVYEPPYEGAKPMLVVEDLDDKDFLTGLFEAIYEELPEPKPKKKKPENQSRKAT